MYRNMDMNSAHSSRLVIHFSFDLKDLCALYIVCWSIVPFMGRGNMFRALAVACSGIFLMNVYLCRRASNVRLRNYMLLSIMMVGIFLICNILGNGNIPIGKSVNLFVFVMLGTIAQYYYTYDIRKLKKVACTIIAIYLLTIIPSLIAVAQNPYVLRNASGEHVRVGIERYAGSYGYVYGCVLLVTFLTYDLHRNPKKVFPRIMELIAIVALCYLILQSGFTTAIILTVVGIVAAMSVGKNKIRTTIAIVITAVILSYLVPIFLDYVIKNWELPNVYKAKILYLNELIDPSKDVTYGDSARGKLLSQGLLTVLRYPLSGSVIISGVEEAGGHQEIIDVFANYGLVYALLFYRIILTTPYNLLNNDKSLQFLYLAMIILLGVTDTFDYTTMTIALFVGPCLSFKKCEAVEGKGNRGRYESSVDHRNRYFSR